MKNCLKLATILLALFLQSCIEIFIDVRVNTRGQAVVYTEIKPLDETGQLFIGLMYDGHDPKKESCELKGSSLFCSEYGSVETVFKELFDGQGVKIKTEENIENGFLSTIMTLSHTFEKSQQDENNLFLRGFEEAKVTYRIKLPGKVIETNGETLADNKGVQWVVPVLNSDKQEFYLKTKISKNPITAEGRAFRKLDKLHTEVEFLNTKRRDLRKRNKHHKKFNKQITIKQKQADKNLLQSLNILIKNYEIENDKKPTYDEFLAYLKNQNFKNSLDSFYKKIIFDAENSQFVFKK